MRYRRGVLRAHDLRGVRGASDDEDPERFSSVLLPSHVRLGGRPRSCHLAHLARGVRHVVYFMRRRDAHRADRAGLKDESGRIRAPNARMRPLPKNGTTRRCVFLVDALGSDLFVGVKGLLSLLGIGPDSCWLQSRNPAPF